MSPRKTAQEKQAAAIDTALLALIAVRGIYCSDRLVLRTAAESLPKVPRVTNELGRPLVLGRKILRRWDRLRKEWG